MTAPGLTAAVEGIAHNKGELFASFDVDAFEVPHGRDEIWRFTPLRRLRGLHDGSARATGSATITVSERPGVYTQTVRRGDPRLGEGGVPTDRVAAQAFSSFNSATLVTVERDTQVVEPVGITVTGPGEGAVAYGHLQVRIEELGEAVVVIDHRGGGTYADNVEFVVDDAARLTAVWIADWADDTVHLSAHHARIGKDAVLRHVTVMLGGDVVRMSAACGSAVRVGTRNCWGCISPTTASTWSRGCWRTTPTPTASRTCCIRVHCKVIRRRRCPTHTRSGWVTC